MSGSKYSKQCSFGHALPILLVCFSYFHGLPSVFASSLEDQASQEERVLTQALQKLRGRDMEGAIRSLAALNRSFPDNEDYALLYRMALQRQEAQQWYRYQDWVELKNKPASGNKRIAQYSQALRKESQEPGRVNELKRATWLILATGKYPAPRKVQNVRKVEKVQEVQDLQEPQDVQVDQPVIPEVKSTDRDE